MARAPTRPARDPTHARDAILDAALKRFTAKGYRGARISDIAKDAGYSEALVYFHFSTKAELFRAMVQRIDVENDWYADTDETAEALVEHMRQGELRYHNDARFRGLDHVWAEALGGEKDLLDLLRPQLRTAIDGLDAQLGRFDAGAHPKRTQLVHLLMAVSYGTRVLRRYDADAISPEEAAELLAFTTSVVLESLAGRGPQL